MNFGVFIEFHVRDGASQAQAFEDSFNTIDAAESFGVDSIWLAEYHFQPERSVLASPLVIASAIAARTNRVRIGLGVQVLPLTNPLRTAEEAATVDHISKGRLDFGAGRSGLTKYYHGYNIPYSESRGRFSEALEVIMKAWTEQQFSYDGEYFSYHDVTLVPKPYQKPHPPTRIAVSSVDTFSTVGALGFPIFIFNNLPVPQMQERLVLYRQAREEAGHTEPADIVLRIPTYVAKTAEKARSEPEASTKFGIQYAATELILSAATEEMAERARRVANLSYDEILSQRVMYGTPEALVERLQEFREALGISGVVLEVNYGGRIPHDQVLNSIRLLAEKVMPAFK